MLRWCFYGQVAGGAAANDQQQEEEDEDEEQDTVGTNTCRDRWIY